MDWAAMFILAEGGQTYARLRFNVGPGGEMLVPVSVDYTVPFGASNHDSWQAEYMVNLVDEDQLSRRAPDRRIDSFDPRLCSGLASAAVDTRQLADPFYDPFRRAGWDNQEELQLLWEEYQYEY
jgi:hypothetical protein